MPSSVLSRVAADPATRWIALGWGAFIAENVVLSENRDAIILALGGDEARFRALYGAASTLACGSIAYGWLRHGRGARAVALWDVAGAGAQARAGAVQSLGLVGFSQLLPRVQSPLVPAAAPPAAPAAPPAAPAAEPAAAPAAAWAVQCPMDFRGAREEKERAAAAGGGVDGVFGVHRVTRHPMLMSLGLFGLGGALATPWQPAGVAMGLGAAAMALVGGAHVDSRHRRGIGGRLSAERDAATSLLPFGALLTGAQSWARLAEEVKWSNAALALAGGVALAATRRRAALRLAVIR